MKKIEILTTTIILLFIFSGSKAFISPTIEIETNDKELMKMPNVIFLIGDGMGPVQIKAASLVEYGNETKNVLDQEFPLQSFYITDDIDGQTTDSAAGGSALSTGQLTKSGVVGMDRDATYYIKNILEYLQNDFGYSTGIVTTTEIAHATPAVFSAHVRDREMKSDIIKQALSKNIKVILGGGQNISYIGSDTAVRNLGIKYKYDTAISVSEMMTLKETSSKLLGVFERYNIPYELERNVEKSPSLIEMGEAALSVLKRNNDPYFLMIEGGRIDHAGHRSDPLVNKTLYNVMETIMFEKTVKMALEEAKNDGNTIVIVGADHETGGLKLYASPDLDNTLPTENNTREENNIIRTRRANQLNVTWKHGSHTSTKVRFFGYGFQNNYTIEKNVDVFWALNQELNSFPVILQHKYTVDSNKMIVDFKFRDEDSSVINATLFILYKDGEREIISNTTKTGNYNLTKEMSIHINFNSSRKYISYFKINDYKEGIDLSTISFSNVNKLITQNVKFITPTTSEIISSTTTTNSSTTTTSTNQVTTSSSTTSSSTTETPISLWFMAPIFLLVLNKKIKSKK